MTSDIIIDTYKMKEDILHDQQDSFHDYLPVVLQDQLRNNNSSQQPISDQFVTSANASAQMHSNTAKNSHCQNGNTQTNSRNSKNARRGTQNIEVTKAANAKSTKRHESAPPSPHEILQENMQSETDATKDVRENSITAIDIYKMKEVASRKRNASFHDYIPVVLQQQQNIENMSQVIAATARTSHASLTPVASNLSSASTEIVDANSEQRNLSQESIVEQNADEEVKTSEDCDKENIYSEIVECNVTESAMLKLNGSTPGISFIDATTGPTVSEVLPSSLPSTSDGAIAKTATDGIPSIPSIPSIPRVNMNKGNRESMERRNMERGTSRTASETSSTMIPSDLSHVSVRAANCNWLAVSAETASTEKRIVDDDSSSIDTVVAEQIYWAPVVLKVLKNGTCTIAFSGNPFLHLHRNLKIQTSEAKPANTDKFCTTTNSRHHRTKWSLIVLAVVVLLGVGAAIAAGLILSQKTDELNIAFVINTGFVSNINSNYTAHVSEVIFDLYRLLNRVEEMHFAYATFHGNITHLSRFMHYQQARLELNTVISDAHITDQTSQAEAARLIFKQLADHRDGAVWVIIFADNKYAYRSPVEYMNDMNELDRVVMQYEKVILIGDGNLPITIDGSMHPSEIAKQIGARINSS
uniref:Atrial natriuretic peptide-converting enzyme n=1 Tax=Ascaris lumbricoides TaxID=6252 RepID=A0A0M3I391_ASCLU